MVLKKVQFGSKYNSTDCTPHMMPVTQKHEHPNAVDFNSENLVINSRLFANNIIPLETEYK